MGQRYVQEYDENGNAIDPAFWLENNNTYAGEFNGGLDRDNLPQATIVAAEVTGNPFNTVRSGATTSNYTPDMTRTDWQGGEGTGTAGIDNAEWTAATDAHYDIYWSGRWSWNGAYSNTSAGAAGDRPTDADPQVNVVDTMTLRMTVDGTTVAVAGPFEDAADNWATFMCGSIQLPAGAHTFRVECLAARQQAQNEGAIDGACVNDVTFADRCRVILQRSR